MTLDDQRSDLGGTALLEEVPQLPDQGRDRQGVRTGLVQDVVHSEMTLALLAVRDRRDRAAFAQIFAYFGPRLKAMLMRGGLRDGSAEDVVQDVMLAVWNKAAQFDPHRAEASAWIYRIARNRQIDLARRRPLPMPETVEEQADDAPDAVHCLAFEQEARALREALSRLAPDQRRAIEQAYMEDLPHSEISRAFDLPLGTIKSRIRLGLERLRRDLKDLKE
jgi:RNA polymerase sigma-70 factor (ECF subfamily)